MFGFLLLHSWNRLPKDLQNLLTNTAIEMEGEGPAIMIKAAEIEDKELQELGWSLLTLPYKEAEKYLNAFYEHSWEGLVFKKDPEYGLRMKEIVDRLKKK